MGKCIDCGNCVKENKYKPLSPYICKVTGAVLSVGYHISATHDDCKHCINK